MSPSTPESITDFSAVTSPRRRWLKDTSSTRPARRAASTIEAATSPVWAIGFSVSTCTPASSAAIAISAWRKVGVAIETTSSSASASICRQSR